MSCSPPPCCYFRSLSLLLLGVSQGLGGPCVFTHPWCGRGTRAAAGEGPRPWILQVQVGWRRIMRRGRWKIICRREKVTLTVDDEDGKDEEQVWAVH